MGVTGLWRLVEGAGKEVALESLDGKVLAVDASILLNQAVKGMKEQPNAHLHVLFLRLCKLLTYRIKPIFVFDGGVPALKRQTIAARQKRREEASVQANSVVERLRKTAVQKHAIDSLLGRVTSHRQPTEPSTKNGDLFELPPLPPTTLSDSHSDNCYELPIHDILYSDDFDIGQVDIHSEGFLSLPLEYQHEILEELRDHTKFQVSSAVAAPDVADEFSSFQVAKILKSSALSQKIDSLRKQMLTSLVDHAVEPGTQVVQSNRIMSEDTTHYLLIKTQIPPSTEVQNGSRETWDHAVAEGPSLPKRRKLQQIIEEDYSSSSQETEHPITPSVPPVKSHLEQRVSDNNVLNDHVRLSTATGKHYVSSGEKRYVSVTDSEESDDGSVVHIADSASSKGAAQTINNRNYESYALDMNLSVTVPSTSAEGKTGQLLEHMTEGSRLKDDELVHTRDGPEPFYRDSKCSPTTNILLTDSETQPPGNAEHSVSSFIDLTSELSSASTVTRVEKPVVLSSSEAALMSSVSPGSGTVDHQCDGEPHSDKPSGSNTVLQITIKPTDTRPDFQLFPPEIFAVEPAKKSAKDLRDQEMHDEFVELAARLNSEPVESLSSAMNVERGSLYTELQKQESASLSVTRQMVDDAQELLRLFGVPFLVSPAEAEAQCAKLDQLKLCDGIITDDSDVWLFGGSRVLKNFFQQDKFVLSFCQDDIQRLFGLDREKMIALALVCGSDYTDGIQGAGPVTALEIMAEFDPANGINALRKFKQWLESIKGSQCLPISLTNTNIKDKLRKLVLPSESFPNPVIVEAYLNPTIDDSTDPFEWGKPDLDLLRIYATRKLNWTTHKVDALVCPVLKKLNSSDSQKKLGTYFDVHTKPAASMAEFQSKRLKLAIERIMGATEELDGVAEGENPITDANVKPTRIVGKAKRELAPRKGTGLREGKTKCVRKGKVAVRNVQQDVVRVVQRDVILSESSDSD